MPPSEEDTTEGVSVEGKDKDEDGKGKRVGEIEGKDQLIFSDAISKCSEIAAIAEYDVIDFCIKTPLTVRTHTNPLRGAGRGGTHNTRLKRIRAKDRKKRGKMSEGLRKTEKVLSEDRDKEKDRGTKSQGELNGEGASDHSASEGSGARTLTGFDKPLYLHSSPLHALCSSDHVRRHTDFR